MAHTFIYTTNAEGRLSAIKFESKSKTTTEFMVTFLTASDVPPFVMKLEDNRWHLPSHLPEKLKGFEKELLEAARKFQR